MSASFPRIATRLSLISALVVSTALVPVPAMAASTYFTALGDNSWTLDAAWTNGVPGVGDYAYIEGGRARVDTGVNGTADRLYIGNTVSGALIVLGGGALSGGSSYIAYAGGSTGGAIVDGDGSLFSTTTLAVGQGGTGSLTIQNSGDVTTTSHGYVGQIGGADGTVDIVGSGSKWAVGDTMFVGISNATIGRVNLIDGGMLTNDEARVGTFAGSEGIVTVNGAGSRWENGGMLLIGDYGTGTVNVQAGGYVDTTLAYLGNGSGSDGTVNVDGTGSLFKSTSAINVGMSGTGRVTVTNGGKVEDANGAQIATGADGAGTVTIDGDGSSWTSTGTFNIGQNGTGTLTIQNSGDATSVGGYIGDAAGSDGTVNIDGAGSKWINTNAFRVGNFGDGVLNLTNGGALQSNNAFLAFEAGSTGTVTVNGDGSLWTHTNTMFVGERGEGTLNIQNGGDVASITTYIGDYSTSDSTVNVDGEGSNFSHTYNIYVGNSGTGALNLTNGGDVENDYGRIASGTGSVGVVTVDGTGSVWTNNEELYAGFQGNATLNIQNGGSVSNTNGYLGFHNTSDSAATVDGGGSSWTNSGDLNLGYLGKGTLTVQNGGSVSNNTGFVGLLSNPDSSTVTIDGTGSSWTNSSELSIGYEGKGILNIQNGGSVSNTHGYLGNRSGSTGTATVDGTGSSWTNSHLLNIGYHSTGTLTVQNGGSVSNTGGYIGYYSDGTGTVTVDGAGSNWTNSSSLNVGYGGDGTLNIQNGGSVTNTYAWVGRSSTSSSTATVDGAGSTWTSTMGHWVGKDGVGTLTLSNGGALQVDDDANAGNGYNGLVRIGDRGGSTGTLNVGAAAGSAAVAPGSLTAAGIFFGAGSGTLNFNHTSSAYDLSAAISGAGDINLLSGTTSLSGDVSGYTGTLTVNGGTFAANNDFSAVTLAFVSGNIKGGGTLPTLHAPAAGFTLAPGNSIGTLNVSGDLTLNDNSVFEVEFDDTSADKVIVSGTATVDGKIQYRPATASYTSGTEYVVLEAGSIMGTFNEEETVNSERLSGMEITTTVDRIASTVSMKIESGAFEPQTVDRTGTAHSTASYLDSIRGGATGALSDDIDLLAALPTAELDEAMESVSGKRTETVQQVENVYNRAVTGTMKARQLAISGGVIGGTPGAGAPTPTAPTASLTSQKASFAFADELGVDMPALSGDSLLGLTNNVDGDVPLLETEGDGKSAWLRLFGQFGGEDKDLDKTGYDYTLGGFAGGMDMAISDKLTAGLMLAVGQANVTMDEDTGASDINSYNLGGYGVYDLGDDMFANGLVMLGYNKIDNNRHVVFGATDRQANGDTDSLSLRADVGIGKRFEKNGFEILPTANIGYAMTMQDAYTEQGAGGLNLSYDDQTTQSFLAEVGVEVAKEYKLNGKAFRPYFGLAATLDDPLDDRKINSGFVGASMYSVDGDADTTVGVSPRTGFVLELENGTKVILDYAGDFDRAGETHSFSTGVRFGF